MLAYHLNESTGIVELRPRGRLEARDFASLALTVDSYLEDHGKLRGVLIELEHFPGWDDWEAVARTCASCASTCPRSSASRSSPTIRGSSRCPTSVACSRRSRCGASPTAAARRRVRLDRNARSAH